MTISPERTSRTMSDLIAEEIRVALTRQRMSQRQFAVKLGVSPAWLNYRLTGVQEIGVNDLKRIADALGVGVYDLLPPADVAAGAASTRTTHGYQTLPLLAAMHTGRPRDNRPPGRPAPIATNGVVRTAHVSRPPRRKRDR
jgi:transcriptional regulator with XRE-family HTH domain